MKVGFVSIIGRPNVGKSTLLNKVLDYKVSITSSTPQTTRDQIKGIYNDDDSQIILIDTPGIHKPKQKLGETLNEVSYKTIHDVDVVLFLQPSDERIGPGDRFIIETIKTVKNKVAVLTKIDLITEEEAKLKATELKSLGFSDVIGVSNKINASIDAFIAFIKTLLPEGERLYSEEDVTDVSMRFIAKEVIRESAIENTKDEIPHAIGVVVEQFIEPEDEHGQIFIQADIFIERDSQKGILIGAQGSKIKTIGSIARKKLVEIFGQKVYLELNVKVNKNWTNKPDEIKKMGY